MREILNDIVYCCGIIFISYIVVMIIGAIILKIKEITYDAHQNSIELHNLKRKLKEAREEIEDKIDNYPDRNISEYEDCLAILDKLIAEVGE